MSERFHPKALNIEGIAFMRLIRTMPATPILIRLHRLGQGVRAWRNYETGQR